MKMTTEQIQCPNCQSYKTTGLRSTYIGAGIVFAILSLPFAFILIGIPFVLAGIALAIYGGYFVKKGTIKCRNCKNQWIKK